MLMDDTLNFAAKFTNAGNGPGYADKLKTMGYTHVVSLRPGTTRWPTCFIRDKRCMYSLWCGFAFFKQEPDLAQLERSTADGIVLMERRTSFCDAETREYGGTNFGAAELTGTELSQWVDFFSAKIEDSFPINDTPMWFYSAIAKSISR
jgi:hypothetical protein